MITIMNSKTILASLTAIFLVSMMFAPAFAANDPRGDATDPNFDIKKFGIKGGDPYVGIFGHAGATVPSATGTIYAYVLITDDGIYAVTSHPGVEDSTEVGDDVEWHAHKVTLSGLCVATITDDGVAVIHNNGVSVTGTSATSVSAVLTAELTVSSSGVCVTSVFDTT